jgi:uncharacterized protein
VPLGPTAPGQRIQSLDVLRGLALVGVLIENMQHFVSPTYAAYLTWPTATQLDRAVVWGIRFACENKVYLLFAFLFGVGISLQLRRSPSSDARFDSILAWRMGTLFLIGIVHAYGVWDGDILMTYAMLGATLLVLRRLPDTVLVAIAAASMALPSLMVGIWLGQSHDPADLAGIVYPVRQTAFAFAAIVLGHVAGRRGWLDDPAELLRRSRRALPWMLPLALAANVVFATLFDAQEADPASTRSLAVELCAVVGTPTLAALYVLGTLALLSRPVAARRLRPLGDLGRTTLTQYLLQSIIGVGLIHQLADHPPGPITPPTGVVLSLLLLAGQTALSVWWLRRNRYGPVEWFWRSVTYGRRQPLRIAD